MNPHKMSVQFIVLPVMLFMFALAHAEEWEKIANPEELQELLSGKEMDGKYWVFFFRPDGKMAYL